MDTDKDHPGTRTSSHPVNHITIADPSSGEILRKMHPIEGLLTTIVNTIQVNIPWHLPILVFNQRDLATNGLTEPILDLKTQISFSRVTRYIPVLMTQVLSYQEKTEHVLEIAALHLYNHSAHRTCSDLPESISVILNNLSSWQTQKTASICTLFLFAKGKKNQMEIKTSYERKRVFLKKW